MIRIMMQIPFNNVGYAMKNNANFDLIKKLGLEVGTELWKYVTITKNIKKQDLLIHHYNIAFNVFRKCYDPDKTVSESVRLFFEVKSQIVECGGKVFET